MSKTYVNVIPSLGIYSRRSLSETVVVASVTPVTGFYCLSRHVHIEGMVMAIVFIIILILSTIGVSHAKLAYARRHKISKIDLGMERHGYVFVFIILLTLALSVYAYGARSIAFVVFIVIFGWIISSPKLKGIATRISHKISNPLPAILAISILILWVGLPVAIIAGLHIPSVDEINAVGFIQAIKGCSIKGNINQNGEKIYHLSTQKYYKETVIETEKGDEYFCSTKEAEDKGFRASKAEDRYKSDSEECTPRDQFYTGC